MDMITRVNSVFAYPVPSREVVRPTVRTLCGSSAVEHAYAWAWIV
jgi:hypothetical protein